MLANFSMKSSLKNDLVALLTTIMLHKIIRKSAKKTVLSWKMSATISTIT